MPAAAVVAACSYLESRIDRLADQLELADDPSFALRAEAVIRETSQARHAPCARPDNAVSAAQSLLRLKNDVAHGNSVTKLEAYVYIDNVRRLTSTLQDAYERASASDEDLAANLAHQP
jgi:hypothetical protein